MPPCRNSTRRRSIAGTASRAGCRERESASARIRGSSPTGRSASISRFRSACGAAGRRCAEQDLIILRDRANLDQGLHAAGHDLAATTRSIESNFEQYDAYRATRAAALTNLLVQIGENKAGRGIYLNVLQALNDWGAAITSEARTLIDYNVLLANLERQTGTILETHGLVFVEERFGAAGPLCLPGHERMYSQDFKPIGRTDKVPE